MIGAPLGLKHPDLAQVRKWSVSDFVCVQQTHLDT